MNFKSYRFDRDAEVMAFLDVEAVVDDGDEDEMDQDGQEELGELARMAHTGGH